MPARREICEYCGGKIDMTKNSAVHYRNCLQAQKARHKATLALNLDTSQILHDIGTILIGKTVNGYR